MNAAAKYQQDVGDEPDRPLKVCSEAGRRCVKNIHKYPILSVEWVALVDSLKQLMRLVHLEGRIPANTKVSEVQGRDAQSEGTLWDQEQHENAIRILVEEAKVNLCLRMMNDYKKWHYDKDQRAQTCKEACEKMELNQGMVEHKCTLYEESLGTLLWKALIHVETLQLMDIPLLIEHCDFIFRNYKCVDNTNNPKLQETLVLYYFSLLMKHSEKMSNPELLAKSKEFQLVRSATKHILLYAEAYPEDLIICIAEGLSALADNEDFRADWEPFFYGEDQELNVEMMKEFMELEEKIVKKVLEESPERKKDLRPLLDFFKTLARSMK